MEEERQEKDVKDCSGRADAVVIASLLDVKGPRFDSDGPGPLVAKDGRGVCARL